MVMNMEKERKLINKREVLIIGAVLLIALGFFLWRDTDVRPEDATISGYGADSGPQEGLAIAVDADESRLFADINMHGFPVRRVYLDEDTQFTLLDPDEMPPLFEQLLLLILPPEVVEEFLLDVDPEEIPVLLESLIEAMFGPDYFYLLSGVHFLVQDGGLAFYASSCPDQLCIRSFGLQRRAGGFAACLPNNLFFAVERLGDRVDDDLDFIGR